MTASSTKGGDVQAARELFNRAIGKPTQGLSVDVAPERNGFDPSNPWELIERCEAMDRERQSLGLATVYMEELPAELRELRQKALNGEIERPA